MVDQIQQNNRDADNRAALTIAGILIAALIVGFLFMSDWYGTNDVRDISPAAGNIARDNMNGNTTPPAPGTAR